MNARRWRTTAGVNLEPSPPEGLGQRVAVEEHDRLLNTLQKRSGGPRERAVAEEARGLSGV